VAALTGVIPSLTGSLTDSIAQSQKIVDEVRRQARFATMRLGKTRVEQTRLAKELRSEAKGLRDPRFRERTEGTIYDIIEGIRTGDIGQGISGAIRSAGEISDELRNLGFEVSDTDRQLVGEIARLQEQDAAEFIQSQRQLSQRQIIANAGARGLAISDTPGLQQVADVESAYAQQLGGVERQIRTNEMQALLDQVRARYAGQTGSLSAAGQLALGAGGLGLEQGGQQLGAGQLALSAQQLRDATSLGLQSAAQGAEQMAYDATMGRVAATAAPLTGQLAVGQLSNPMAALNPLLTFQNALFPVSASGTQSTKNQAGLSDIGNLLTGLGKGVAGGATLYNALK